MSLLIKNGEIVTESQRYVADIFCENETITRIDTNLAAPPGAEVIDAAGKYVFPGSSIRTCIFICRSWARLPRTRMKRPAGRR